ncbi:TetR/AcrR family transcriptional regulator [Jongsikchunia kroppenstedtii]|uniref:TetR/AcrR family transcriptional regulator n=1 Tax=Jongsikchunia kroppenstedtii TaxID=1121721 RepID=UPI000380F812|nr:TetR/AcrR family transcriptional regulator [Jongsikchunia kroppenstedtii]
MSSRNEELLSPPSIDERVLDAARRCLLRAGGRRLTLAEVAREAGVSRPTVYRRWPQLESVIGDVLTRDLLRLIADVAPAGNDLESQVARIVAVAEAIRDDELLSELIKNQPDVLAPYIFARFGSSQLGALQVIEAGIAAGQRAGEIRAGDPSALAAMVLTVTQAAVQSYAQLAPVLGDGWSTELYAVLHGYLASPHHAPTH